MSKNLTPKFSSSNLVILGLTFKSLVHFELVFMYGVRQWSSFIFLHVIVQFFPAPFIEETILYTVNNLTPLL